MAILVPAIKPPPPQQHNKASGVMFMAAHWAAISCPTVPCPAITDIIYSTSTSSPLSSAQAQGQASLLSSDFKGSANLLEKTNSNSPVNLFHLNKLSLEALGFLLATWEHRVFITACMLEINPFDQYGVAAGKLIAKKFLS